ncbi:MAG TPA: archease [Candidatus Eisenbacteria bacterium]|nr:archease [Candidatus Eisenbacteria bacterium]
MGSFRFVDEVAADRGVDLSARSLTDAFETAARALVEMTVDPSTVQESIARHIVLDAPTLEDLLFDWLSELIDLEDRYAEVYVRTAVQVSGSGPCRLVARLHGGRIVPGRTERRADVQGVSLRPFVLEPCNGGWHAHFVVDLRVDAASGSSW